MCLVWTIWIGVGGDCCGVWLWFSGGWVREWWYRRARYGWKKVVRRVNCGEFGGGAITLVAGSDGVEVEDRESRALIKAAEVSP